MNLTIREIEREGREEWQRTRNPFGFLGFYNALGGRPLTEVEVFDACIRARAFLRAMREDAAA